MQEFRRSIGVRNWPFWSVVSTNYESCFNTTGVVLTLQWCTHQGPASMLTYTREALLELNHVRKSNWVTRQLIFCRRLWLPRDHRTPCDRRLCGENNVTADTSPCRWPWLPRAQRTRCKQGLSWETTVNGPTNPDNVVRTTSVNSIVGNLITTSRVYTSSTSSTSFAFLNAQSIGNKWLPFMEAIALYKCQIIVAVGL